MLKGESVYVFDMKADSRVVEDHFLLTNTAPVVNGVWVNSIPSPIFLSVVFKGEQMYMSNMSRQVPCFRLANFTELAQFKHIIEVIRKLLSLVV